PATSGRTPEATPVVSTVLMSRVPVYFTLAPVCCSQGATIFRNAACSSPPQVPITVTVLPLRSPLSLDVSLLVVQADAASTTTASGTTPRSHLFMRTPLGSVVTSQRRRAPGAGTESPGRRGFPARVRRIT